MKKTLLTLFAILFVVNLQAQSHLVFKGIPLDGSTTEFMNKLRTKGLKISETKDIGGIMKGDFAGYSDCTIYVYGTRKTKKVFCAIVAFPSENSWSSLYYQYSSLKSSYTKKYGEPLSIEEFITPYYEGDGYELQALKKDKCTYSSKFTTEAGDILISITYHENSDGYDVSVGYIDNINRELNEAEQQEIIDSEI